jgi:hypothetical protein
MVQASLVDTRGLFLEIGQDCQPEPGLLVHRDDFSFALSPLPVGGGLSSL